MRALVIAAAVAWSVAARAEERSSLAAFTDFFRWKEPIPAALRGALDAYEQGRFFAALASLDPVLAERKPAYALDDAAFLRSLSLVGLGWDDLAVSSLRSVIEADPPGPYYVPALLELVEIHDRAGRWQAIADACQRHVDKPLRTRGSRNQRIARLLFEFGTLRPGVATSTRREKSMLSKPEELAVILEKRRERPSDRLFYRCGLALFRLGRHEESLRALFSIGIESPYYPYARVSIAQNYFAAERRDDAARTLARLDRYPKITREERALGSRARLLHAAIAFDAGELDRGIGIARSIADDDAESPGARLLITTALLDAGKPSLALVYDQVPERPVIGDEARRALVIGSAYASLGDRDSAARVLRGAAGHVHKARLDEAALDEAAERMRGLAAAAVAERRGRAAAERAHVASGMRILLAYDGPWSFGTMMRRVRATLGAGAYRELALGTKPQTAAAGPSAAPWLAYLANSRRANVERVLDRLADVEDPVAGESADASLRILNGYLLWLEQAGTDRTRRRDAAQRITEFAERIRSRSDAAIPPLAVDPDAPAGAEVTAFRRRLLQSAVALEQSPTDAGAVREAREDVAARLRNWADRQLREVLRERDAELRVLELDLEVALSEALGPASGRE